MRGASGRGTGSGQALRDRALASHREPPWLTVSLLPMSLPGAISERTRTGRLHGGRAAPQNPQQRPRSALGPQRSQHAASRRKEGRTCPRCPPPPRPQAQAVPHWPLHTFQIHFARPGYGLRSPLRLTAHHTEQNRLLCVLNPAMKTLFSLTDRNCWKVVV